jgi:hypothetical protein
VAIGGHRANPDSSALPLYENVHTGKRAGFIASTRFPFDGKGTTPKKPFRVERQRDAVRYTSGAERIRGL